jgi:geranylgeranyl diphosphate synthase, type II
MDQDMSVVHDSQQDAAEVAGTSGFNDIHTVRAQIEKILEKYIAGRIGRAKTLSSRYEFLWQTIDKVVLGGGKRLRPYLIVLGYELFGKKADDKIYRAAAGFELLHQAMLMHDDIIDRDYQRHNMPNIAGTFRQNYDYNQKLTKNDKEHLANATALLAGDLAITSAYDIVRSSGLPTTDILMLEDMLDLAIFNVVAGELLDSELATNHILDTDVRKIAELKTASYSFEVPLVTGAQLARASEADIEVLREFGRELGIAFQYADDIIGVFGAEKETGKSTTSDLEEGKHTFMLQYAYTHGSLIEKNKIDELLGKKNLQKEEADKLREIFTTTGARLACELEIAEHAKRALSYTEKLQLTVEGRYALENIITQATRRKA